MAKACHYPRCTGKITDPQKAWRLMEPEEPEHRFCSLTCVWSWLKEHVEGKSQDVTPAPLRAESVASLPHTRIPPAMTPKARKLTKTMLPGPVTKPTQTYAPGEFQFNLVPDEGVKSEISTILAKQIEGPYRFAWHALSPYVRVGPSDPNAAATVSAGERLHMMGEQSRTLRGLQDTMDFAVHFAGREGSVQLREVLNVPGQPKWAQQLLGGS